MTSHPFRAIAALGVSTLALTVLAVGHWNLQPRLRQAVMVVMVMSAATLVYVETMWRQWRTATELAGGDWIAWGLVCLFVACVISLAKAGTGRGLLRTISEWNDWAVKQRSMWWRSVDAR